MRGEDDYSPANMGYRGNQPVAFDFYAPVGHDPEDYNREEIGWQYPEDEK